ncbi:MAG: DUF4326 domain-containing protein [Alkalilacustris sp.]
MKTRSDRSDRSDPFGILDLFRSDPPPQASDRSDRDASPAPAGPTGPTAEIPGRTEIEAQNQRGPTGPTGPTATEGGAAAAPPPAPTLAPGLEALDAFEERAAIREADGGQAREEAEAGALAEVAQAAGMAPEALQRLWAAHPDARTYLAHLTQHGPATVGAVGSALGWGATRAWQAEARLRAAGLVVMGPGGRAVPSLPSRPVRVLNAREVGRDVPGAVYCGRPSPWGNPFRIGKDGTRAEVVAKFREWLMARPELVAKARAELRGRDLICWCAPAACHCDVLAEVANAPEEGGKP